MLTKNIKQDIHKKAKELSIELFSKYGDRFIVKEILMESMRLTNNNMKSMITERKVENENNQPLGTLSGSISESSGQGTIRESGSNNTGDNNSGKQSPESPISPIYKRPKL